MVFEPRPWRPEEPTVKPLTGEEQEHAIKKFTMRVFPLGYKSENLHIRLPDTTRRAIWLMTGEKEKIAKKVPVEKVGEGYILHFAEKITGTSARIPGGTRQPRIRLPKEGFEHLAGQKVELHFDPFTMTIRINLPEEHSEEQRLTKLSELLEAPAKEAAKRAEEEKGRLRAEEAKRKEEERKKSQREKWWEL